MENRTKYTREGQGETSEKQRKGGREKRIEATHIRMQSIHWLREQQKHARWGPRRNRSVKHTQGWPRMQRRSCIHSVRDRPRLHSATPTHHWLHLHHRFIHFRTSLRPVSTPNSLAERLPTYTTWPRPLPQPQEQQVAALTTFSISSLSHCDVSLTISDS